MIVDQEGLHKELGACLETDESGQIYFVQKGLTAKLPITQEDYFNLVDRHETRTRISVIASLGIFAIVAGWIFFQVIRGSVQLYDFVWILAAFAGGAVVHVWASLSSVAPLLRQLRAYIVSQGDGSTDDDRKAVERLNPSHRLLARAIGAVLGAVATAYFVLKIK